MRYERGICEIMFLLLTVVFCVVLLYFQLFHVWLNVFGVRMCLIIYFNVYGTIAFTSKSNIVQDYIK